MIMSFLSCSLSKKYSTQEIILDFAACAAFLWADFCSVSDVLWNDWLNIGIKAKSLIGSSRCVTSISPTVSRPLFSISVVTFACCCNCLLKSRTLLMSSILVALFLNVIPCSVRISFRSSFDKFSGAPFFTSCLSCSLALLCFCNLSSSSFSSLGSISFNLEGSINFLVSESPAWYFSNNVLGSHHWLAFCGWSFHFNPTSMWVQIRMQMDVFPFSCGLSFHSKTGYDDL